MSSPKTAVLKPIILKHPASKSSISEIHNFSSMSGNCTNGGRVTFERTPDFRLPSDGILDPIFGPLSSVQDSSHSLLQEMPGKRILRGILH
ncbi:hypothetical protein CEXT_376211 [Caerostris extrusa]|uniref:Uncharacterized protein n=1 Tax=Caerostris extrusa TaxID=172846 RepID=A0AAV4NL36_CAEEX|nr:hypothetical protein CEXT_376211 [Caerostris extrusa]